LRNTAPAATGASVPPTFVAPQIAHGAVDWQQAMDKVGGGSVDTLAKRVQVTPVLDNGRIAGVRVSTAGDTALMARLGLRPSDIVTAVNGIPVDSVARGQQILDSLGSATDVRVTVTRDGVPAEITMKLR
jgi:general secretion pathway protein C